MDDDLQQLEAELRRLRPIAPSRELGERIERALAPAVDAGTRKRRPSPLSWWWPAAVLPAAAALALALTQFSPTKPAAVVTSPAGANPASVPAVLKPVTAENVLYAASDEGLVTLDDGTPARRERLQFVDTITWRNPRTHASLTWTVPREEVRVVPVSYQ